MRVAFQGEPGAYSEQALIEYFGAVETKPCASFDAVFDSVAAGECDAGMIPIENSIAGRIHQNDDLLARHTLKVVGEYSLRVRHCLIVNAGVTVAEIKKAISHPQALAQCADFLKSHRIQPEPVYDTAGSVKMLKELGARDTAAIASRRAAELYGMQILQEGIEDDSRNTTRFLAIAKEAILPNDESKGEWRKE
ncbi:MAG: P-protein [Anaerolineales bacterium]|nr:P-protein [Anaerolineales bacterium]